MKKIIIALSIMVLLITTLMGCNGSGEDEENELERRLSQSETAQISKRDLKLYDLPQRMFANLPPFPEDFYQVRILFRTGKMSLADINYSENYWKQPEWFPYFEERAVPNLREPPKGRFGAFGYLSYPGDAVAYVIPDAGITTYFWMRSSWIVETYQGIMLSTEYPEYAEIREAGARLFNGDNFVMQNSTEASQYFEIVVEPEIFVLKPNFPKFRYDGITMVNVTVRVKPDTPLGNYVVGLSTARPVPPEYEKQFIREYLNLYTGGHQTQVGRPYYQLFISVISPDEMATVT